MFKELQQVCAEDMYSNTNTYELIRDDIGTDIDTEFVELKNEINTYLDKDYYKSKQDRIDSIHVDVDDLMRYIVYIIVPIQGKKPIQSVAGQLGAYKEFDFTDPFDAVKTGAELLALACKIDICNIISASNSETGSMLVESRYSLEQETLEKLSKHKYLPPMLTKPLEVVNNHNDGHLTFNKSVLIGKSKKHSEKISLDVINIANSAEMCLDMDIIMTEELANKPLDTVDKITSYNEMISSSNEVYEEIINNGNKFYLTHGFDSRGRFYSKGYHINYQGSPYKRACTSLKTKEVITK